MNNITRISLFLCCLMSTTVFAQHKLSGIVRSKADSSYVGYCLIVLNDGPASTLSDTTGHFVFHNLPNGTYTLSISCIGYKDYRQTLEINGKNRHIRIELDTVPIQTQEITVNGQSGTYMRDVENMGIYAGKKTEVITIDSLVANLSTNNARQVYARIPGLNIWENDGAGLQLSIGGRGLDPNRTSNFNVRQNGYDISADALGYPESYYTPPIEGVEKIQVIRGAASLQYGTQFGGLLNFVMRKPVTNKKIQLTARNTIGSFAFYNSFTSLSGTCGKFSYYTFFQYKKGNGWRPNSQFDDYTFYSNINYALTKKTSIGADVTIMSYLAQQPGGLTDDMFRKDPRQSNRERNWFEVQWNMYALHFTHKFNESNEFNIRVFGLSAYRNSVGFREYRVATVDDETLKRDLIKGTFTNWGTEARYLKHYSLFKKYSVLLVGARYYSGFNHSTQGQGSAGKEADFDYVSNNYMTYDYRFPNRNVSLFAENILNINHKLSVTPGLRYEYIRTTADGYYGNVNFDLAGNVISYNTTDEYRTNARWFLLGGLGFSYKPMNRINVYANISQNYRSITFNDMRISNPSSEIDPDMRDETGYTMDIGIRNEKATRLIFDVSVFYLRYNNRIGEVLIYNAAKSQIVRRRGNIGEAASMGIESYLECDVLRVLLPKTKHWSAALLANTALVHSQYLQSSIKGVEGNQVEFVPKLNIKTGVRAGYRNFKASFQYTYLSQQFSDATNAVDGGVSAVVGIIPAYYIMDVSLSYQYKIFKIEGSINNLANQMYFTRRATGYPGPGIIPSDGRSFYLTLQIKI